MLWYPPWVRVFSQAGCCAPPASERQIRWASNVTLQDLGNIGEFVAAMATLATLGYLALQIRANTRESQAASRSSVSQSFIDLLTHLSLDAETSKIVRRGLLDPQSLDADDTFRFDLVVGALLTNSCWRPFVVFSSLVSAARW